MVGARASNLVNFTFKDRAFEPRKPSTFFIWTESSDWAENSRGNTLEHGDSKNIWVMILTISVLPIIDPPYLTILH